MGCLNPIEPEDVGFEDYLVVDARITDEEKLHQITLSRTVPLNSDSVIVEEGASVNIEVDGQQVINFVDIGEGRYRSQSPFAAQVGSTYQLNISLQGGETYQSDLENMISTPEIDQLYGEFVPDINTNIEGSGTFSFFFDSEEPTSPEHLYLIEWSETYQVKVPFPSTFIWRGGSVVEERTPADQVEICYVTKNSTQIITHESLLESGRVAKFPVRTFESTTQAMALRYSLEIKYYALSSEAYSFWELISSAQDNGATLLQEQPGSITGNISPANSSTPVLGRFDVLSVKGTRNFYNRLDWQESGYKISSSNIIECNISGEIKTFVDEVEEFLTLNPGLDIWFVESGLDGPNPTFIPMVLYLDKRCTNCTYYGDNMRPSFWID